MPERRAKEELSSYARVDVLALVRPLELSAIRERLLEEVPSSAARTRDWDYAVPADRGRAAAALEALESAILDVDLVAALGDTLRSDLRVEAAIAHGSDDEFTAWSRDTHGLPDHAELTSAREVLAAPAVEPETAIVSADELATRFRAAMERVGVDNWTVQLIEEMAARASVRPSHHEVRIRARERFSAAEADRLVAHELGGHVIRSRNAERQPTPFAALSLGNATETEEGLAVVAEDRLGVRRVEHERIYAARTIAVHRAADSGVLEVARELVPLIGLRSAVDTAIRVKRGLRNPNRPGGLFKDAAYFRGSRRVAAAIEADADVLPLLYATKWSLSHLPLTRRLVDSGELSRVGQLLPGRELLHP